VAIGKKGRRRKIIIWWLSWLATDKKKNARCYGPTMSHRKEKRREEIKKKKTNKQLEGTKGYTFDINESKVKELDYYTDMKDNKTKMK